MKSCAVILMTTLLGQALAMPDVKAVNAPSTFASPANIPFDELVYIIKVRNGENPKPKRLTPCAKAILACCKDKQMNENCSESLKCGAFFFDVNPCEDRFVIDALSAARAFYEQLNSVTK